VPVVAVFVVVPMVIVVLLMALLLVLSVLVSVLSALFLLMPRRLDIHGGGNAAHGKR
jgi:hypothetical protein